MTPRSNNPILRLIHECHRRSLWQVLGIYLAGGWVAWQVAIYLEAETGLPDWFSAMAFGLLVVGLPMVLGAAIVQEGIPGRAEAERAEGQQDTVASPPPVRAPDRSISASTNEAAASGSKPAGLGRLFTWGNAFYGGVGAMALWGVVATGWILFSGGLSTAHSSTEVVLTAIARVDDAMGRNDWVEAYRLAHDFPADIPDSTRATYLAAVSRTVKLDSEPSGAKVSWRPYDRPDLEFDAIGESPIQWPGPRTDIQFLVERDGYAPRIVASSDSALTVRLRRLTEVQANALEIPAGSIGVADIEARLAHAAPFEFGPFLLERYEVTNREYQEFVDAGGYSRREYWEHPFQTDGVPIPWEEAISVFVDSTGRPGPSTWSGGGFPAGKADHPVTGISWYEAAAYARFRGQQLPTLFHWYHAARMYAARFIVPFSNYDDQGTAPVGSYSGISPHGAYDMAGNAREWLANPTGSLRYTAGGGWNDPEYSFGLTQPQPPMDRSETNGVRLMRDLGTAAAYASASRNVDFVTRDFYAEKPASDERFAGLLEFYRYDDRPLNDRVERIDTLEFGIRERITFDSGYGADRMVLYLYRPLKSTGALQVVAFFPGSGAFNSSEFAPNPGPSIVGMLVRNGRAVAVPVFEGMFERQDDFVYRLQDPGNEYREHVLHWRQDLGRSLDYLETRPEIDRERFGYFGSSMGGRMGAIMLAVEPRFRAAVLEVPGLSPLPTQAMVDPFNFLPRVTLPVLVMSGEYDQIYPLEDSARPFYHFLGTREPDKRHFIATGGHAIPRTDATRETLDWYDRYLGPVR